MNVRYPVHAKGRHFHKPSPYDRERLLQVRPYFQNRLGYAYGAWQKNLFVLWRRILQLPAFLIFVVHGSRWQISQCSLRSTPLLRNIQHVGHEAILAWKYRVFGIYSGITFLIV